MSWATSYIKELEQNGITTFRPRGFSMMPYIQSGQEVTVKSFPTYEKGDIVLCTVMGRQYLHFVKAVGNGTYQIGNARGFINGWTSKVYGKVV